MPGRLTRKLKSKADSKRDVTHSLRPRDIRIVVRGAGDVATGVIQRLVRSGFWVAALEISHPTAIRQSVALSTAMFQKDGRQQVEDIIAFRCQDPAQALALDRIQEKDGFLVPLVVDAEAKTLEILKPTILVDAILAKKNCGTHTAMAPWVIALGPGFCAGEDADVVIETMRGHDLGRLIFKGEAMPNTGIPGSIGGQDLLRVLRAPQEGKALCRKKIGDIVAPGEVIVDMDSAQGRRYPVEAAFEGFIRGLIPDGFWCPKGFKIADVDPRIEERQNAQSISDKARAVGGGVLEAVLIGLQQGRFCERKRASADSF